MPRSTDIGGTIVAVCAAVIMASFMVMLAWQALELIMECV